MITFNINATSVRRESSRRYSTKRLDVSKCRAVLMIQDLHSVGYETMTQSRRSLAFYCTPLAMRRRAYESESCRCLGLRLRYLDSPDLQQSDSIFR